MTWEEVCSDPSLQDLPYKIETNSFGQIVMSPHFTDHSYRQAAILLELSRLMQGRGGRVAPEFPIATLEGVRVADVVWGSAEWRNKAGSTEGFAENAPEICIEVLSWGNSTAEIAAKMQLYFAAGAHEVWLCDREWNITFHSLTGELIQSALCPEFPRIVSED